MKRVVHPTDCVLIDGTPFPIGEAIADNFTQGDRLIGLSGGQILHIPLSDLQVSYDAVSQSVNGFRQMMSTSAEQVTQFLSVTA